MAERVEQVEQVGMKVLKGWWVSEIVLNERLSVVGTVGVFVYLGRRSATVQPVASMKPARVEC